MIQLIPQVVISEFIDEKNHRLVADRQRTRVGGGRLENDCGHNACGNGDCDCDEGYEMKLQGNDSVCVAKECGIFSRGWFGGAAEDLEYKTNEVVEKSEPVSQVKADLDGARRELSLPNEYFDELKPECMNSGHTHAGEAELTRDASDWLDKNHLAQRDEKETTQERFQAAKLLPRLPMITLRHGGSITANSCTAAAQLQQATTAGRTDSEKRQRRGKRRERKKTERKSEGKVGQRRESKKTEVEEKGVKAEEEGKERGRCETRVVQGNESDEEGVEVDDEGRQRKQGKERQEDEKKVETVEEIRGRN